jgi:hypothetical protein
MHNFTVQQRSRAIGLLPILVHEGDLVQTLVIVLCIDRAERASLE